VKNESKQANWRRSRRADIREQIRDDIRENRQFVNESKRGGGDTRPIQLAGWILRIGKQCKDSRHLDGLLVQVGDATDDPDLLPPYDTCREESCECEVEPVDCSDVPKVTRIAERVGGGKSKTSSRKKSKPKKKSKRGCLIFVLIVLAVIYVATRDKSIDSSQDNQPTTSKPVSAEKE
jgi:hypothetical protein